MERSHTAEKLLHLLHVVNWLLKDRQEVFEEEVAHVRQTIQPYARGLPDNSLGVRGIVRDAGNHLCAKILDPLDNTLQFSVPNLKEKRDKKATTGRKKCMPRQFLSPLLSRA